MSQRRLLLLERACMHKTLTKLILFALSKSNKTYVKNQANLRRFISPPTWKEWDGREEKGEGKCEL